MRKFQVLFLISFLTLIFLLPQISCAAESAPARRNWLELSAAGVHTLAHLKDGGGHTQLSHQDGLSGRVLLEVTPWLSLGIEDTWFQKEKNIPFVAHYRENRYAILSKWTLTPDTRPKTYLLVGAGETKRELQYTFALQHKVYTRYLLAGLGVEVPLWKEWFLALEGYGVYNFHKTVDRFFALNHRFEPGIGGRVGVRF